MPARPVLDVTEPQKLRDVILASLDDDKAEEIVTIDLQGRTAIADYMVIATGRSTRQVAAMADHLREKLEKAGLGVRIEGLTQADWVLVDAGDVIVHLFRPEVRAFYQLEKMWAPDLEPRPARSA
ncbi:MAG TPA: ribosome silencing factor [Azospirillaceae bacterium]|nr:ribosome silencing factor [Azospirillaceae bacterium]